MSLKVSIEKRNLDDFAAYTCSRMGILQILRVTRLILNIKKELYGELSDSAKAFLKLASEGSSFLIFCGTGNTTYQCGLQYKKCIEQIDIGQMTLVNFLDTVQKTCGVSSSLARALIYIDDKEIFKISENLKTKVFPTLFKRNLVFSHLFSFYTLGKNGLALSRHIAVIDSTDLRRLKGKRKKKAQVELANAKKQVLLMSIKVTSNVVSILFAGIFFTQTCTPVLVVHSLSLFSSLLSITSNIADNLIKVDS